ncbi:NAD-dependent epimerase/dehydratase family protein [Aromatoleum petrolei]|uniref:NAD(P)H-binding protein n=1 Tax=Aromatoleum petrolei TaxID=76116 RepID=A0ABX1MPS1_9RHOO|nr:NAD-dependent epimerase/dehydratase family protein [Aromatoleum petrolei]NMF89948.1 NAD(P)H-binding protein [Aromatoleum petrolei]QTQ36419.1 NAD(P)-binding domain-containing protein [Aromatoleum petrolei]
MNILLTGASGFIGRNIATALTAAGHRVIPASRENGIDFRRMHSASDWQAHLAGIDAVINCVGIIGENGGQRFAPLHTLAPSALFRACAQVGIRRVLQISALGADETAFSAYHLSKRAADDCLRSLDLDWFVLRPSLIYGRSGKSARLFMRLAALPRVPVIGDGQQAIQPVHIGDVVATVMRCLASPQVRQALDIVGPETVTFADWLQRMREAQGLPRARLVRIPVSLAMALARVGRYINPILQPENLRMLETGYKADFRPLARFLGRMPHTADARLFFSDGTDARSAS